MFRLFMKPSLGDTFYKLKLLRFQFVYGCIYYNFVHYRDRFLMFLCTVSLFSLCRDVLINLKYLNINFKISLKIKYE
jgi:hypothetical protein